MQAGVEVSASGVYAGQLWSYIRAVYQSEKRSEMGYLFLPPVLDRVWKITDFGLKQDNGFVYKYWAAHPSQDFGDYPPPSPEGGF